jgi:hypothetical protein
MSHELPPLSTCPALSFDDARRENLRLFAQSTFEQRIEWLAQMLDLASCAAAPAELMEPQAPPPAALNSPAPPTRTAPSAPRS